MRGNGYVWEYPKNAPAAARTRDPKLRRLVLYPTELPEQVTGRILAAAGGFGKFNVDKSGFVVYNRAHDRTQGHHHQAQGKELDLC